MSISKKLFDTTSEGTKVYVYRISNSSGAYVEILNYGGILRSLCVPDASGKMADVLVGFDSLQGYIDTQDAYYGALIGRCANRIRKGHFTLNGQEYQLAKNNGENHLHGGNIGFNQKIWNCDTEDSDEGNAVELTLHSPDGEENYPGNLDVKVTYTFDNENRLSLIYEADCDRDTVINLTNHAYFNLAGHNAGCICHHQIYINALEYNVSDSTCTPTGRIAPVAGTPLDFTTMKALKPGLELTGTDPDMTAAGGYDHNYVLNKPLGEMALAATLKDPASGRIMDTYTDQPGMQLYTGNFMHGNTVGKGGYIYKKRGALCLETQHYPDAVNFPQWPSTVLKAGEHYKYTTVYAFRTE